jgi:hypothetical protein
VAVDDQPGTDRFTSSSAYRSRVMNQPVTRGRTPASTRTNIARSCRSPEQHADQQGPTAAMQ